MEKIVFHIDVNAAFLSWEAVYRLAHRGEKQDLRLLPSAVGGDVTLRHGIILAKSLPAKAYGIKTGETLWEARQKCPQLILAEPNYSLYEKCSAAFLNILRAYSDQVEQYSIDEAFMDMSSVCHLFGTPEETAGQIKDRIHRELGFTVNVGISTNKLLAKMASDFRKPDRVHTLYPGEIREKMWPLPVSELFFVGHATTKKLFSLGIRTIGELAVSDPAFLKSILKKQGEVIWAFANGIDCSPVLAEPAANKGYGNSTTLPFDATDEETAQLVLLALCETVGSRLRAAAAQVSVVSVTVRYGQAWEGKFPSISHQKVLQSPTSLTRELYEAACGLFAEVWDGRPIRHLGVHTGRVSGMDTGRQLHIFDEIAYEKLWSLETTVDEIRRRFGKDALLRAAFLNRPVPHMSGGVQKSADALKVSAKRKTKI